MRAISGLFFVAILASPGPAFASDAVRQSPAHCFTSTQFDGWRAADTKTVYIRANSNRYYRLELARQCTELAWPDARLILAVRGGGLICSALDLDLKASEGFLDVPEPCFVKAMTELSPAEVAALPKKSRP